MKVTDEMIAAYRCASVNASVRTEGDRVREALGAVLALIEPEGVDITITARGLGGIFSPPVTITNLQVGTVVELPAKAICVERTR